MKCVIYTLKLIWNSIFRAKRTSKIPVKEELFYTDVYFISFETFYEKQKLRRLLLIFSL